MIDRLINIIKVIFLGVVEGISEWLPISSTGHMLLIDNFITFNASQSFKDLFFIVIQLGAIFAIVMLFFNKINPFRIKNKKVYIEGEIIKIWSKIFVACIPGAIITLLFDELVENYFYNSISISIMLIVYGIAFILIEKINKNKSLNDKETRELSYKDALYIGLFQCLSIFPGTSRSGATILGALFMGVNRKTASEFTFFLAIPVMIGLSFIKLMKFGFIFTYMEMILLIVGSISAFITSFLIVRFLMNYIKKHDFRIFGWYRIILGVIILALFI